MASKHSRCVAFVSMLLLLLDGGSALSDNGRASLAQTLRGVDLEQRRERLRSLQLVDVVSSPSGASSNTDEESIEANRASFPRGGSILEKNRFEGVSDYLYEGDINLTEEQLAALESKLNNGTSRQKRQASKVASLWANKKVFYYFDISLGDPMKALVKKTLAYLAARTCLTFVENATATNRIRVFPGSGCYSNIGMIGGEQDLSLADGCNTPAGCGAVLTAAATWKSKKVVLGNATNPDLRDTYAMCNDWIKAPAGKKVQVQMTVMKGVMCLNGCWTHGIEFKTLANKLMTNPRSCCDEHLKKVITSTINPTPVITYNVYQQSEITYLYKYI
uniref:Peptidase M12A domain containing protein n=1 Tax=Haemonchus contortus TaxID=6289 RepID=W6NR59_HAECO